MAGNQRQLDSTQERLLETDQRLLGKEGVEAFGQLHWGKVRNFQQNPWLIAMIVGRDRRNTRAAKDEQRRRLASATSRDLAAQVRQTANRVVNMFAADMRTVFCRFGAVDS